MSSAPRVSHRCRRGGGDGLDRRKFLRQPGQGDLGLFGGNGIFLCKYIGIGDLDQPHARQNTDDRNDDDRHNDFDECESALILKGSFHHDLSIGKEQCSQCFPGFILQRHFQDVVHACGVIDFIAGSVELNEPVFDDGVFRVCYSIRVFSIVVGILNRTFRPDLTLQRRQGLERPQTAALRPGNAIIVNGLRCSAARQVQSRERCLFRWLLIGNNVR